MTDPPLPPPAPPYGYSVQASTALSGFWRRLGAYVIDAILTGIVVGIISSILGAILRTSMSDATGFWYQGGLIGLVIYLAYFGYFWSRNGQTLGYMALGIRLVRVTGQPISVGLALARAVLVYLSFALCLVPAIISAIMIGTGSQKQAIHDSMLGTLVVRT
jgi:uncharacterized RDD family membrane protein YckC